MTEQQNNNLVTKLQFSLHRQSHIIRSGLRAVPSNDDDATPAFGNPPLDEEAFAAAMIMENSLEFWPNEGRSVQLTILSHILSSIKIPVTCVS